MTPEKTMIRDLFKKDIDRPIQGVVTIGNEDEEQKWQELEEYVCTEEITQCFRTFFRRYRESIASPTDKMGVWITGFFGSGKSHFLKILGYILENEEVAGVRAAEYFKDKVADELILADIRQCTKANNKVVLFNIDSKAKSDSKSRTQAIMDIMLRAFNESVGYCGSNPWVADMERTLDEEGHLAEFIEKFEAYSGRKWVQTRAKALLNRDHIVRALAETRSMSEESARAFVDDQTRNFTNSTEDFAKIIDRYCRENKSRVIFLMDEVGQFIGDNSQLMLNLQTCVEDLSKYCRGKAWVVVTSQQELKAMIDSTRDKQQDFSKIQGRFNTRLLLSGANADEVIKQRILAKKGTAFSRLHTLYETNSDRLSSLIMFQGKPSWSGYKDADEFSAVYPFVSYQFELLQKVFEAIRENGMSEGRHLSQNERSLLDAFQTAAKNCADEEPGLLVPFDRFFQTVSEFLDYDTKTVFTNAAARPNITDFDLRVLHLLFMIKHVKEMPATIDRMATMMVERVDEEKAALKEKILDSLIRLEEETLIQKNGDIYDFLTNAEQDVNRQINNSGHNEGEILRTILDIIFDKVLESNKFRYEGRYDFGLNRFVDSESKGSFSQENITLRFCTQFSGSKSASDLQAESVRDNAIIVDLSEGGFAEELIRANKIATFRRNNSASMSASLTEIMSKKSAEQSDRIKRAEELIRVALRTAPIYLAGSRLDIKQKDGRERLQDAMKEMVRRDYFKLGLVGYYYPDQKAVFSALNEDPAGLFDISTDPNRGAYAEILAKTQDDKRLMRRTTVKSLLDFFSKRPYGWKDLDTLGMIGTLWKLGSLQILIHDNLVQENNNSFKNDFARKSAVDTMVVRPKELIDEALLYQVKRIMNDTYAENLPLEETALLSGVKAFFQRKLDFLTELRGKYGSDYPGAKAAAELAQDFASILRSGDALTVFNEIVSRKDSLEDRAEALEQLESFYKTGSSQHKNYQDAAEMIDWYNENALFQDLSRLQPVIDSMNSIVTMEMPFGRMNELADLVFRAGELKARIQEEKLAHTKAQLEADLSAIRKERTEAASAGFTAEQTDRIQEKAEALEEQYASWFGSLSKTTQNMDSYITASRSSLEDFRRFIGQVMSEGSKKQVRSKRVTIIDLVPVANKKVTSTADVDKVLAAIRSRLLAELKENDELNLG